jgi:carbon storage regulator
MNGIGNLTISRRAGESFVIGGDVSVKIVKIDRGQARIVIRAPKNVPIFRSEILDRPDEVAEAEEAFSEESCPACGEPLDAGGECTNEGCEECLGYVKPEQDDE